MTSTRRRPSRRVDSTRKWKYPLPPELQRVHLNAAGIDIGAEQHFVAVPPGRDAAGQDVRCFGAFTVDLQALAEWLEACGIETIAMESTGVYWIPLYELLVERGFEVLLVNAQQVRTVPGRKTDVLDCQWLQELHTYGLLRGAFRPDEQTCVLRSYLRQRATLVEYAAHHIQHIQKALEQMNLKLTEVVSDVVGATGLAILRAILAGERRPEVLAALRDYRCQHDEATIARALQGQYRAEHLFALRQAVELFEVYQSKIAACDRQIEQELTQFAAKGDGDHLAPAPRGKRPRKPRRSEVKFDARTPLYRATGVDLTAIDGIQANSALTLLSEIGTDMSPWPTEKHFCSWLGLAPGNKVSGGKRLSGRTKPSKNRAAAALRMAAQTLTRSRSALGAYCRRLAARIGAPKAITATARKLACRVYHMLKFGTAYVDAGQDYYEQRYRERVLHTLRRRASEFGFHLVPASAPTNA